MQQHQRSIVIGVAFLLACGAMAQVEEVPAGADSEAIAPVDDPGMPDPDFIYTVVEQMPEFPGREPAMFKYLAESFKYPESAVEDGIQGKVFVQFIVERDGSITDVKVLRGTHSLLDREAVRVIKSMPPWKPGKQNGQPVRVRYNLPINCVLPK